MNGVWFPSFRLALRDDVIRKNPCDGVFAELKRRNKRSAGVKTALTLEQQRAFLNFISEDPVYNKWLSLMVFLFGTGCRIGEAIGILWKDLDMERRVIDNKTKYINYKLIKCGMNDIIFANKRHYSK